MAGYRSIQQDKQENILVKNISSEYIHVYILDDIHLHIHKTISYYIEFVITIHLFTLRDIMGYNGISKDIQRYLLGRNPRCPF
jgi:hypothetical protein